MNNKTITGLRLKKQLGIPIFFKFFRGDLTHHNFKYKLGDNADVIPFSPSGECKEGGLYFTDLDHIFEFMEFGTQIGVISLYNDSKVYVEETGKYKTDKFFIEEIVSVNNFLERFLSPLEAVKQNGDALKFINEQTPEICLSAVKQNGWMLRYVKKQTPEICLSAVKQNGRVLCLVKNRTRAICLEAYGIINGF
jgi:hypothetical protein